jgi:hypothetical protein
MGDFNSATGNQEAGEEIVGPADTAGDRLRRGPSNSQIAITAKIPAKANANDGFLGHMGRPQ